MASYENRQIEIHPARIKSVEPFSPADDAGFYSGCCITAVDGHTLRDIIDWQWYSDAPMIDVSYIDGDGDQGVVTLEREEGEAWGIEFEDALFQPIATCRNACIFCFMRQLPEEVRDSLVLRDDDYRLSFLQGNFVTLTNVTPLDEARIIEQRISPLNVSLHCVDPDARRRMMGKHAQDGFDSLERLLDAGIEFHAQIVLVPGVNDGDELRRTLDWAIGKEGISRLGIVPLGYTKHQAQFTRSFDEPCQALEVIKTVEEYQSRAMVSRGCPWVFAADEFYCNAYGEEVGFHIPDESFYGEYEMFEDGIGIVRSMVDEWRECDQDARRLASALASRGKRVHLVQGCIQRSVLPSLLRQHGLASQMSGLFVENGYFGGNVNVTGLLCGIDIAQAIRGIPDDEMVAVPSIIFNADGLTLDDMTLEDICALAQRPVSVVSCSVREFLQEIESLVRG